MKFKFVTTQRFEKAFSKLDRQTQKIIKSWIEKNLLNTEDPRQHGKALTGNYSGYWRYRVGNYRILCDIRDNEVTIVAVNVAHRSKVYKD